MDAQQAVQDSLFKKGKDSLLKKERMYLEGEGTKHLKQLRHGICGKGGLFYFYFPIFFPFL